MQVIDTHINVSPDGKWFNTNHDASIDKVLENMSNANIAKGILISTPTASENSHVKKCLHDYPDKFKALGFIDFEQGNYIDQAKQLLDWGFSGIKIHPRIQGVDICSDEYNGLWEYFDQNNMIVHIDGYLQLVNHKVSIKQILPLAYENHIRDYKNVTFIYGHSGFHKVFDCLFLTRSYANFYCNICYSINFIHQTSLEKDYKFFLERCDQKIVFASDFPELSTKSAIEKHLSLMEGFDIEKKNNVFYNNALKIFWNKNERS